MGRRRLREKKNVREKLNMPFWRQQSSEEISLAQVIPERGLRTPQILLLMKPVRTLGKGMPKPVAPHKSMPNLWPMGTLEDALSPHALAPLGRSPPPRPGEWNAHRDALAPLGKPPLLPRTPAQHYESCSNDGAWVPTPSPCPEHELGT